MEQHFDIFLIAWEEKWENKPPPPLSFLGRNQKRGTPIMYYLFFFFPRDLI